MLRRMTGTTNTAAGDHRTWSQRYRDRGLARRATPGPGLKPSSRLGLVLGFVAVVAVIGALAGPLRRPLRDLVNRPDERIDFTPELVVGRAEDDQQDIDRIADGSTESGLSIVWAADQPTATACDSAAPMIRLRFDPTAQPKQLHVFVGRTPLDDGEAPELRPGPRMVSIRGAARCEGPIEFTVEHGWQRIDVDSVVNGGDWIELFVHERWETPDAAYDSVAIGEVRLVR